MKDETNFTIRDLAEAIVNKTRECTPGGNNWTIAVERLERELRERCANGLPLQDRRL